MLATPEASSGHAAATMTKLLVGLALFITFLIGLVMMASIGISRNLLLVRIPNLDSRISCG